MIKESSKKVLRILDRYALNGILLIGILGIMGSLYFSEALDLPPCDLCWYQRILFFPIPLIALIGLVLKDQKAGYYILALSIIGLPISIYHHLLKVTDFFPKETVFCGEGRPGACSVVEWELWKGSGTTIPLLVALAFVLIIVLSTMKFVSKARSW